MKEKQVAIYVRVSTNDQSTSLQKAEIRDYLEKRGFSNLSLYEDEGKTGTNGNRSELKRLMRGVRERKVDLVICWKMDRLFRSLKDLINTLQEFNDLGVEFISLKDQIDLSTSSGKLMFHIIGAFAEFEASLIRERVKAGLANAKANGTRLGRPGKINQNEAVRLREKGLSLSQIAKALRVSKSTVSKTLKKIRVESANNSTLRG